MGSRPLVSGIIIFLNAEEFIAEAIGSVFAQTYDYWELLLVDDGSTDKSTEVAQWYAEQYPLKIRYLEHEKHQNRGMSASRNLGISQAKGEYLAFLDADDVWFPYKLEQQLAIFHSQPEAGMVYGRTLIWHSWAGKPEDRQCDHTIDLGVHPNSLVQPPVLLLLLLQNKCQTPTTCNAMIKRDVLEKTGTFEEHFKGMYEDQVFFAKVNLHFPVFVADEIWAKYRQHSRSHSSISGKTEVYYSARTPFLNWATEYLAKEGVSRDTEVWQVLEAELWACRHPFLHVIYSSPRFLWRKMRGVTKLIRRGILVGSSSA